MRLVLEGGSNLPNIHEYLLALAHAAAVPAALQGEVPEEVEPCQVWRARWEAVSVAVLITGTLSDASREWCVPVVPITIEPRGENDRSLILESGANMFGVDATLWCGLATEIPLRTLDVSFGTMPVEINAYCKAFAGGESVEWPNGTRAGRQISSVFDSDAEIEAVLEDDLAELREAPGLAVEESEIARKRVQEQLAHIGLDKIMTTLGLAQPAAMAVLRGQVLPTSKQAPKLARLIDMSPDELMRILRDLPSDVVHTIEHPRWRQPFNRIAIRSGRDAYDIREEAAHEILSMAARQSGRGNNYEDRLARWIEEHDPSGQRD